jgi:hypothetical protein
MMTATGQRALWGGLGGLLPTLVTVGATGLDTTSELTGILTRAVALVLLGAIFTAAHSGERQRWRLVELGIAAPAMISLLLSSNPIGRAETTEGTAGTTEGDIVIATRETSGVSDVSFERSVQRAVERLPDRGKQEIDPDSLRQALRRELRSEVLVQPTQDSHQAEAQMKQLEQEGYLTVLVAPAPSEKDGFLDGLLIRP